MFYRSITSFFIFLIGFSTLHTLEATCFTSDQLIRKQTRDEKFPVDISLVVVDLKYNKEQGVKVCEFQRCSVSLLTGFEYVNDYKLSMGDLFVKFLEKYQKNGWYDSICFVNGQERLLQENRWTDYKYIKSLEKDPLFLRKSKLLVNDQHRLSNYNGFILTTRMNPEELDKFSEKYPGMLFFDKATHSFLENKKMAYKMLDDHPQLKSLKPHWKCYEKRYTKNLAKKIIGDFNSDLIVIKPLKGARGNGIIITETSQLDKHLKYILTKSKKKLYQHPDKSYSHWAFDKSDVFVVEEFIQSDSVKAPQYNNQPFDGTMRAVCCLVYDNQEIELHFLGSYWKLPLKSLNQKGTLNELHKSTGEIPGFAAVDAEVWNEVQKQLSAPLTLIYEQLLFNIPK